MTTLLQGYRQFRAHAFDRFKRHASGTRHDVVYMHEAAFPMT